MSDTETAENAAAIMRVLTLLLADDLDAGLPAAREAGRDLIIVGFAGIIGGFLQVLSDMDGGTDLLEKMGLAVAKL